MSGDLKRETESLIVATQNQSIRMNLVKAKIDKSQKDMVCRLCKKADESIDHVVSGCRKLAQKEYKKRHDNLRKIVNWNLARKLNFEAGDKWYEREPESFLESEDYKILWDFSIHTDHVTEAWRPDLVVDDKKRRTLDWGDGEREDRQVSRSKKDITKGLECESNNYTISCGLFRYDT